MKVICLNRIEDETGISGTGVVARGVILPSGKVVIEWTTKHKSVCVYDSLAEVEAIHGHGGKTEVIVADPFAELNYTFMDLSQNNIEGVYQDRNSRQEADRMCDRIGKVFNALKMQIFAGTFEHMDVK